MSHAMACDHVRSTLDPEIRALFSKLGGQMDDTFAAANPVQMADKWAHRPNYAKKEVRGRDVHRVISGLASHWLRLQGFGGNERSLHTKTIEEFRGREFQVSGRRVVKTGTRYAPSGGYDSWTGEWDSESGGLYPCQTHVLVEFYPSQWNELWGDGFTPLLIEAKNVRKVYDSLTNQRLNPDGTPLVISENTKSP